jgi:dephospho-CoA kinase
MIIGVTGGIATGKSSVAALFKKIGLPVVSADELAREAVHPGSDVLRAIVQQFGPEVLFSDGTLNRERLSQFVFTDAAARRALNQITHPAIARLAESQLAALVEAGADTIIYEAPLLYEAGAEKRADKVLVVTANPAVQKKRLMARDGIDAATADLRISAQMPLAEKVLRADFVVDNSGAPAETARQVELLCREHAISFTGSLFQ